MTKTIINTLDATEYPHPWTQDQALTDRLLKLVDDEDWDLFGIADVGPLNEKARPGRRPKDLWPTAKAVLMFAVGLADPFTRGWVQNGNSGKFYSYALLELDRRVWTVKRFLRQEGYLYFGGEAYGGALFDTGIRFADAAASCGMGYIGKSNVLVTEKYGPRINMTYLMTDAPLVTTIKEVPVRCGHCTACQKVCMSGAILGDYYFHQRQCEAIINVKPNMDYYSDFVKQDCDRCLRVCPQGKVKWETPPLDKGRCPEGGGVGKEVRP